MHGSSHGRPDTRPLPPMPFQSAGPSPVDRPPPEPAQPTEPVPIFGRASVPVPTPPLYQGTQELPAVQVRASATPVQVSWHRPSRAHLRRLADGWGFSAAGLMIAFIGWGVWAAAGRGRLASPLAAFALVLAVGAGLFAVSRLSGRVVWEGLMGRQRRTARLAHAMTGLFFAVTGFAYLGQTSWVVSALTWLRGG